MGYKTIAVSDEAHSLLSSLKQKGHQDSFSKVILRHLPPAANTCSQLLERLEKMPPPEISMARMTAAMKSRGRRN